MRALSLLLASIIISGCGDDGPPQGLTDVPPPDALIDGATPPDAPMADTLPADRPQGLDNATEPTDTPAPPDGPPGDAEPDQAPPDAPSGVDTLLDDKEISAQDGTPPADTPVPPQDRHPSPDEGGPWDAWADSTMDSGADTTPDSMTDISADGAPDSRTDVGPDLPLEERCRPEASWCVSPREVMACLPTPGAWDLVVEDCPEGQGCYQGACMPDSCVDSCLWGHQDQGATCGLMDPTGQPADLDPDASLHDRARAYEVWLRDIMLPHGGVATAYFTDPDLATLDRLDDVGDSAIWTGTLLAAEALRLKTTGAPDARDMVRLLVQTLHLWFNVSGDPGFLARYAAPSGEHPLISMNCEERLVHCDVPHEGGLYDWRGHTSRDQYQGVLLGYALAYEALEPSADVDEDLREAIRQDVVELVEELMIYRSSVPVMVTIDNLHIPVSIDLENVVLTDDETPDNDGLPEIVVNLDDLEDSDMWGFQEFIPDLSFILGQLPIIGEWVPSIPRSGSAIMLPSFFKVALLVTEGVEAYGDRRAAIEAYYEEHIDEWLDMAALWFYFDDCGGGYYGINIAMEPMYNLARLERHPEWGARIREDVLDGRMWPELRHTKNVFFSYIYAATADGFDPPLLDEMAMQLADFPPAPRVDRPTDLLDDPRYQEREPGCDNQLAHDQAVDVADRIVEDFIWQRNPWGLWDGGDTRRVYPGVDYLVAYWMGRHHGFLSEDRPGVCLGWR